MTKNQNDHRNPQSDIKSHQEKTQHGKKKDEPNPNNPKSNKSNLQAPQQRSQQRQGLTSAKGVTNTSVEDEDEQETTFTATSGKTVKQNIKKGKQ